MFIVFEGIEGAGKSTQIGLLEGWCRGAGLPVRSAREPGGTAVGEAIREVLLHRADLDMPAETELFLILGARAAYVRDVVRPSLERGEVFISDRFDLSTFAYQGFGRGLDLPEVREANDLATGGLSPDLYLILDVPVASGLERQNRRGEADRIEAAGIEFMARVHEGYRTLAQEEPRARLVSGTGSPEEVQRRIRELLAREFPGTFGETQG